MRLFLVISCLLHLGRSYGQQFTYPKIATHGKSIADFIPKNWSLLDSTSGDLNNDQGEDLAFIIQFRDTVFLEKTEDGFSDTVSTQPRILIIAFYDPVINQYRLIEQSNTFILDHDNPNMEEPFQDMSVSGGVLKINFEIFMNMGSWEMSDMTYKFRYLDNEFILIGAEFKSTSRASGETEDHSYDFLSKRVKISTGNISTGKQKTKWQGIYIEKLKTLKTFDQPLTWEVEKGDYL